MSDQIERTEGPPQPRLIKCPRCHEGPSHQSLLSEQSRPAEGWIERLYVCAKCKSNLRYRQTRFSLDGSWTQDVAVMANNEDRQRWLEAGIHAAFVHEAIEDQAERSTRSQESLERAEDAMKQAASDDTANDEFESAARWMQEEAQASAYERLPSSDQTSDAFEPVESAMKQAAQAQTPTRLAYSGVTAEMDRQALIMRQMGLKPYMVAVSKENHDVLVAAIYDVVKESGADEETRRNALHYWKSHQLGHVEVRGSGMLKLMISDDPDVLSHKGVMVYGEGMAEEIIERIALNG